MSSVIFGDLLRTIAREAASHRALRNCSKEVDGEVSIYVQFAKGGTCNLENIFGDFPGSPVVKTTLPTQGPWVQSLVGELRSHMPHSMAKKKFFYLILIKKFLKKENILVESF